MRSRSQLAFLGVMLGFSACSFCCTTPSSRGTIERQRAIEGELATLSLDEVGLSKSSLHSARHLRWAVLESPEVEGPAYAILLFHDEQVSAVMYIGGVVYQQEVAEAAWYSEPPLGSWLLKPTAVKLIWTVLGDVRLDSDWVAQREDKIGASNTLGDYRAAARSGDGLDIQVTVGQRDEIVRYIGTVKLESREAIDIEKSR